MKYIEYRINNLHNLLDKGYHHNFIDHNTQFFKLIFLSQKNLALKCIYSLNIEKINYSIQYRKNIFLLRVFYHLNKY